MKDSGYRYVVMKTSSQMPRGVYNRRVMFSQDKTVAFVMPRSDSRRRRPDRQLVFAVPVEHVFKTAEQAEIALASHGKKMWCVYSPHDEAPSLFLAFVNMIAAEWRGGAVHLRRTVKRVSDEKLIEHSVYTYDTEAEAKREYKKACRAQVKELSKEIEVAKARLRLLPPVSMLGTTRGVRL